MKLSYFAGSVALACITFSSAAQAQTLFGTFGFIQGGAATANTGTLTAATTIITLPKLTGLVNAVPAQFDATHANAFYAIDPLDELGTVVHLSTKTIQAGQELDLTFTDDNGNDFTFIGNGIVVTQASPAVFHFDELGTLSSTTAMPDGPQLADISGSFGQTGLGGTIGSTFTFVSPSAVPEPGAVALIAGMGLSASALLRRRRK